MKKTVIFSMFMSAVVLSACALSRDSKFEIFTLTQTGVKPFKVKLSVDGNELRNDKTVNIECTSFGANLKKGCFIAEEGEMLELEFKLKQPGGPNWRFTKVLICAGTTAPNPLTDCALDPDQQADFLVVANNQIALMPPNGTIDLTDFGDTLRVFTVRDFNWFADDYVYKIQACKEGSLLPDDCAWADPGGINKGRGR
jgi:hypothetical protein